MASHVIAGRAIEGGYTHVFVMTDGIFGWMKKGFPFATLDEGDEVADPA